ncbi:MAG: hypothetical protein KGH98_00200 [Candidatus Micrarchaeota archaeon]|nr:hypothetical protein [Candidatus Micrarchaeota archaeon]
MPSNTTIKYDFSKVTGKIDVGLVAKAINEIAAGPGTAKIARSSLELYMDQSKEPKTEMYALSFSDRASIEWILRQRKSSKANTSDEAPTNTTLGNTGNKLALVKDIHLIPAELPDEHPAKMRSNWIRHLQKRLHL